MTYYKIKPGADQRRRKDGSIYIANELYTPKEAERHKTPAAYYDIVNVSENSLYWFFGARFTTEK